MSDITFNHDEENHITEVLLKGNSLSEYSVILESGILVTDTMELSIDNIEEILKEMKRIRNRFQSV